jgi:hypothetical protein
MSLRTSEQKEREELSSLVNEDPDLAEFAFLDFASSGDVEGQ